MRLWFRQNAATVAVCLILAVLIFWAIRQVVRNKRQGKTCCGDCSGCLQNCKNDKDK